MKNHERYTTNEDADTLRTIEELLEFGKKSLPKYVQSYWQDACNTMESERLNGLADILEAIKYGDSEEAASMLKDNWLGDGLVIGSVATYLPDGVGVVRQAHIDTYGDVKKENRDFLNRLERWHGEQRKKLAKEVGAATAKSMANSDNFMKDNEAYHGPTTREKFMERVHDTFGPKEARMMTYKMRSKEKPDADSVLAHEQYDPYRVAISFLGETDEPKYVPGITKWTERTYKRDLSTYRRNFARLIDDGKTLNKKQIELLEEYIDNIDEYLANPNIKPSYEEKEFPRTLTVQNSVRRFNDNRDFMYCYDLNTACESEAYGKVTARLYMCPRTDNMIELIDEFKHRCEEKDMQYFFKYSSDPRRNDRFIVYTNYDKINDHLGVLKEIGKNRPDLFRDMDDSRKSPFWGKIDGAPKGVYFGEEPPEMVTIDKEGREKSREAFTSYSQVRADAFMDAEKKWGVEVYGDDKDSIYQLFLTTDSKHFDSLSDISWKNAKLLEQMFRDELSSASPVSVDPNNICFNKSNKDIYVAEEED